jgi:hypothetical protein
MEGYFVTFLPTRYPVLIVHMYFGYIEFVSYQSQGATIFS